MRSLLRIMLGVWVLQSIAVRAEQLPRERAVEFDPVGARRGIPPHTA